MPRAVLLPRARARILTIFSGDPEGIPAWVSALETGDDEGFFGPGSAVWAVHNGTPTIEAGIRALLMQTLHPGALAGVHDHSRYQQDPLGRLAGTVRWLRSPQFGRAVGPAYRILFAGAVASPPDLYRRMLGLRRPWWPAITATRLMLAGMRAVLGTESSSMRFTQLRLARPASRNG